MKLMRFFLLELILAFTFSLDNVVAPPSPPAGGGMVCSLSKNNSSDDPMRFADSYTDRVEKYEGRRPLDAPWDSQSKGSICNISHNDRIRKRVHFTTPFAVVCAAAFIPSTLLCAVIWRKLRKRLFTRPPPPSPPRPSQLSYTKRSIFSKLALFAVLFVALFAAFISSTLCVIIWRKLRGGRRVTAESDENNNVIETKLREFTYSEVTSMIGEKKVIGEGEFCNVYKGCMNGVHVAVKLFKASPEGQETENFQSEVKILETVHHKNLIKIVGLCNEGIHRAIIFELMQNGNLNSHLSDRNPNVLSWELRLAITIGAAEGLEYLHHGCDPPIIHRDFKPENILLTEEFVAKLADFGLSRIFPVQTSRVIDTLGYLDPEYRDQYMLTEKVDIYSFGVVMLVVVTGQPAIIQQTHITQWIAPKIRNRDIRGIVDPRLQGNYDNDVAWKVVELAMACVSSNSSSRPDMNYVVRVLKESLSKTQAQQEGDDSTYSDEITVVH